MNFAVTHAIAAFWRTKRLARRLRTRADVARWRDARVQRFLRDVIVRVPFYADMHATRLEDLPILDKQSVLANFDKLNVKRVRYEAVRAALDAKQDRVDGLVVGQSTGTSGNRGVFVISEAERFTWLGVILAKTLPDFPFAKHKVALALPAYSQLYASAIATGRLALRFYDLTLGVDAWREDLCAFAPDTIVAPPKVLRALANTPSFRPANVFSGAEVLDPLDRAFVEERLRVPVREIYMATEGLFGVGCPHGNLHLAEDAVAFEFEPAGDALVSPLVTDFTRSTQIMARYRMNDLLRLSDEPCACGSPLQRVAAVEGRQDDVFLLRGAGEAPVLVTPDIMRNAVVDADRRIQDFRILQIGADRIALSLAADLPADAAAKAAAALKVAVEKAGAVDVAIELRSGIAVPYDRKLRRVRREWKP
ncbi:F390 synthetase-related protein [Terricaulis sp.]|uniref:F390 synthetase-related protein n=1 Tax=Terricaulis sp. TaxID=2768686 RepID=UPI0037842444